METQIYNYITGYCGVYFRLSVAHIKQPSTNLHNLSEFAADVFLSLFLSLVTCHVQLYTFSSREEELIWPNGNWDCTSGIPILLLVPSPERNNTSEKIPSVSSMTSHGPCTYTLLKSPWHCLIFCMFCAARSPIHPLSGKFSNIWRKGSQIIFCEILRIHSGVVLPKLGSY